MLVGRSRARRRLALAGGLVGLALAGCTVAAHGRLEEASPAFPSGGPDCMNGEPLAAARPVTWSRASEPSGSAPPEWCEAVGPALVADGDAHAGPAIDTLVVVTWNVRAGAGDVVRLVDDLRGGALTGAPVRHFVLLLQEAYRAGSEVPRTADGRLTTRIDVLPPSGERLDVAEAGRRLGLHVFYAPSMPNGAPRGGAAPEDRGNAILSTLPLGDLAALELPFEVQRRVAVAGTVSGRTREGLPWSLRVASGHLDTRSPLRRFLDSFGAGRARQAGALAGFLGEESVALGADLNTWSADFLEDAVDILYRRFPDTPYFDAPTFIAGGVLPLRLDHLLFRLPDHHGAAARRIDRRYGSDHYPVLGAVRFGMEAAVAAGEEPSGGEAPARPAAMAR